MTIPRITLWTQPFRLPFRLALEGFNDGALSKQARQVQRKHDFITITPGAMYILSQAAGRRITEPVRWVLLDSLSDILAGKLRTEYPERQDLLAATFGEILGALVLSLQLGQNVEIIRLLESNNIQTPDFILLERSGNIVKGHLLECKGSVLDVNNVNQRKKVDVCQDIRNARRRGDAQLENIELDKLKTGSGIMLGQSQIASGLTASMTSKNLSVVVVPDGRLPGSIASTVEMATRQACHRVNCVQCLSSKSPSLAGNLITVLHRETLSPQRSLDNELRIFLQTYQNVQRALWAEHDREFTERANLLINFIPRSDLPDSMKRSLPVMIVPTLEVGANYNLDLTDLNFESLWALLDDIPLPREFELSEFRLSDLLQTIFMEKSRQDIAQERKMSFNQYEFISMADFDVVVRELHTSEPERAPKILTSPDTPRLGRDAQNFDDDSPGISRVAEYYPFENATRLRLFVDRISAKSYNALKREAERLISNFRRNSQLINWQLEYFEYQGKKWKLGESWDKFPHPHISNELPGITAWIARDGRAEIIVRHSHSRS